VWEKRLSIHFRAATQLWVLIKFRLRMQRLLTRLGYTSYIRYLSTRVCSLLNSLAVHGAWIP